MLLAGLLWVDRDRGGLVDEDIEHECCGVVFDPRYTGGIELSGGRVHHCWGDGAGELNQWGGDLESIADP